MPGAEVAEPAQVAMALAAMRSATNGQSEGAGTRSVGVAPDPAAATAASSRRSSVSGSKTRLFLPSLYQMCNNDDTDHRDCISWSDDGTTFWVSNTEKFSRLILPMYFRHNNYASFVRQLNMYGFQRSTESKGKVKPGVPMVEHFTHPFFLRGREDLLGNIHRKTSSVAKATASTPAPAAVASTLAQKVEHLTAELRQAQSANTRLETQMDAMRQSMSAMEARLASIEADQAPARANKRRRTGKDDDANEATASPVLIATLQSEQVAMRQELETLRALMASKGVSAPADLRAAEVAGALDRMDAGGTTNVSF